MQRIGILIFALAVGINAVADLGETLGTLPNAIRDAGNDPSGCSACTPAFSAQTTDEVGSQMKKCVESLCPRGRVSIAGTLDKVYLATTKPNDRYKKEIEPLLKKLNTARAENNKAQSLIISEWLKTSPKIRKPDEIRAFNLHVAIGNFDQTKLNGSEPNLLIDEEASESVRNLPLAKKILEFYSEKAFKETDPAKNQLLFGAKFKAEAGKILATVEEKLKLIENEPSLQFLTSSPTFRETFSLEKMNEQFRSDLPPSALVISQFNLTYSKLNMYVALAQDKKFRQLLDSTVIDVAKAASEMGIPSGAAAIASSSSAKCRTAFEMAQQVLPSQSEVDSFKSQVSEAKEKFIQQTKGLICPAAQKAYKDQISALIPIFPPSREKYISEMKRQLSKETESINSQAKAEKQWGEAASKDILLADSLIYNSHVRNEGFSDADRVCESMKIELVPDATFAESTRILVGPLTVKNAELRGINFHELSHRLYYFLKTDTRCSDKSKFFEMRRCLLSSHEDSAEGALELFNGGASQYEAEDFADMISSRLDGKDKNFACLIAMKTKPEDFKLLSLKSSNSGDTHSSELFRLLHLSYLKSGKTSPQCERALSLKGQRALFQNCFKN